MRKQIEWLISKYQKNLFNIAFNICRNIDDANDVVQDTFIQYITIPKEFHDDDHIKAWLIKVAINKVKDLKRSFWQNKRVSLNEIGEIPFEQEEEYLLDAVMKLPEKYRIIIHLFYYEDMQVKEIAEVLDLSANNVKTRLSSCTGGVMGFYADTIPEAASVSDGISDNQVSEFGLQFSDYYDSEQNLEYIINVSAEKPIFGQTVRVEFNGLSSYNNRWSMENNSTETLTGTYWAANTVEGPWVFDIKVPDKSEKTDSVLRTIYPEYNEPVWKGVYIDSIDITPLRITVRAKATDEAEIIKYYHIDDWYEYDRTSIVVTKIKLKNGEVIDYANDRIIDPREINAIYIKERTQIFKEEVIGEENYHNEEILVELN